MTPLYLAFTSGSITYDCAPCGRCCRGLGFADDLAHVSSSASLRRVAAFAADRDPPAVLRSFHTYADGCRFQGDDNGCDLHRHGGPEAKPRICRLFPFSRIVDVEGLWVVLPQASCPWTAGQDSPYSRHADILHDLPPALLASLTPGRLNVRTSLSPEARLALEERLRDAVAVTTSAAEALSVMARGQGDVTLAAPEMWIDLLRTAGEPASLSPRMTRLFITALPILRIELLGVLPLEAIPTALRAFELWLRASAELGARELTGADLQHLLSQALPLLRVLLHAPAPVPRVPEVFMDDEHPRHPLWRALANRPGMPLGAAVLELLREHRLGPVSLLAQLGRDLGSPEYTRLQIDASM
jgi:hypothetical protein